MMGRLIRLCATAIIVGMIAVAFVVSPLMPTDSTITSIIAVETQQDVIQRAMQSVILIRAYEYDSDYGWYGQPGGMFPQPSWQGSGVYVKGGLILTAGHVVDGAARLEMEFEDGTIIDSNEFYLEPKSDVGFVYVGELCKPTLDFEKSHKLVRGDPVFVLGNPFGEILKFSVSKGIISAVDRDFEDDFFGEKLIFQSDTASYPGNSGGPVIDSDGEIVGILVGGMLGGYDNISFCIPREVIQASMDIYLKTLELGRVI